MPNARLGFFDLLDLILLRLPLAPGAARIERRNVNDLPAHPVAAVGAHELLGIEQVDHELLVYCLVAPGHAEASQQVLEAVLERETYARKLQQVRHRCYRDPSPHDPRNERVAHRVLGTGGMHGWRNRWHCRANIVARG